MTFTTENVSIGLTVFASASISIIACIYAFDTASRLSSWYSTPNPASNAGSNPVSSNIIDNTLQMVLVEPPEPFSINYLLNIEPTTAASFIAKASLFFSIYRCTSSFLSGYVFSATKKAVFVIDNNVILSNLFELVTGQSSQSFRFYVFALQGLSIPFLYSRRLDPPDRRPQSGQTYEEYNEEYRWFHGGYHRDLGLLLENGEAAPPIENPVDILGIDRPLEEEQGGILEIFAD